MPFITDNLTDKQQVFDVIQSIDDTLLIKDNDLDNFVALLISWGFKEKTSLSFQYIDNDYHFIIKLHEIPHQEEHYFIREKSFYRLGDSTVLQFHREEKPAYILYHCNGYKHIQRFKLYNVAASKNNAPLSIETTKRHSVYNFCKKDFSIHQFIEREGVKTYYYSYKKKKLLLSKIIELTPRVSNFDHNQLMDLPNSLTKEEIQLMDMILFG